jgi:hypothetical protein
MLALASRCKQCYLFPMSQSQLSIRSDKASSLAQKYAKEDRRTLTQVVEIALELYSQQRTETKKESADEFWDRLVRENHVEGEVDIDLDSIIREKYKPHEPIAL